jgi:hypothetical protein
MKNHRYTNSEKERNIMNRISKLSLFALSVLLLATQFVVAQNPGPPRTSKPQTKNPLIATNNSLLTDTFIEGCQECLLVVPAQTFFSDDSGINFNCLSKTCTLVVDMWATTGLPNYQPSNRAFVLIVDGNFVGPGAYLGEEDADYSFSQISAINSFQVTKGSHTATVDYYSDEGDLLYTSQNIYRVYVP